MTRPKFGVDDVIEDIRALVEEYGADHVDHNRSHRYIVDGKPTCLVGHIMARRGIRVPKMFNNRIFEDLAEQMMLRRRFTVEALELLVKIQRSQDGGSSWGRILQFYDPEEQKKRRWW